MKKLILCALSIICFTFCFAQTNYPIIEKNGQKYYEYTINPGDGLLAIAKKFGIKQTDLHAANQNLSTNIKVGDKILIPIFEKNDNAISSASTIHIVEAKQTLYSISKIYNVHIDSLIALNPSAKKVLQIGDTLIISLNKQKQVDSQATQCTTPNENELSKVEDIIHVVEKKETLFSISKKYNVAIHDLIELNPELKDGLKAGSSIIIKKSTDQPVNNGNNIQDKKSENNASIHKENETKELQDTKKENAQTDHVINPIIINTNNTNLNIAYLLPLLPESTQDDSYRRFVEFYRGSLLAMQEAKNNGKSANIFTYNIQKNNQKIDSILQDIKDKNIDIIIGPAYSTQLDKVLTFSKENSIVTIVPFSNKIDSIYHHDKLLQFNPTNTTLFTTISNNLLNSHNYKYILVNFENCTNKGGRFTNHLKNELLTRNKDFKEITIKNQFDQKLIKNISSDTTIIVLGSSKINDVAHILDSLNQYNIPTLKVWGFEDWGINIIKKYPQVYYYSLFNPNITDRYKNNYKLWFGVRKQTIDVQYDLLGYDITTFALNELSISEYGLTFNTDYSKSDYLQTQPIFNFTNGRWLNTKYYILFWNNGIIKDIK
jgi:LysM repeat protein